MHSEANLLTMYVQHLLHGSQCGAKQGELETAHIQLPNGFQGTGFKNKGRERVTVCMINSCRILWLMVR